MTANFIPVADDFERFGAAEDQAKAANSEGARTEEFRFFQRMLAHARALDKQGQSSAILGAGCHTQGMYVLTPAGQILGMVHQWDQPKLYVAMLKRSLAKWGELPADRRRLPHAPDRSKGRLGDPMRASLYPEDGLVLTEITRALPYDPEQGPRYDRAIASHPIYARRDHAWFRRKEARSFLPDKIEPGAARDVPPELLERLARFHLGTNTDTIAVPFGEGTVKAARLVVVVAEVADGRAECRMEGGTWVYGPQDSADGQNSGYQANLLGRLVYDLKNERFTEFELVALGVREHGGGEVRKDTPNPIPLGVLLTLAGKTPADRLPPAYLERYGW